MGIEWLGPVPDRNHHTGRDGTPVSQIICHWVGAGTLDGAVAHFKNPNAGVSAHFKNPNAGVSAHFIVGTTGRIVQLVDLADTAYHAGDFDVNLRSIGIEHECRPDLPPTPALYAASAWLHQRLAKEFGFLLAVGATVQGHSSIVSTECPGSLDLARIVKEGSNLYVTLEAFEQYQNDVRATIEAMKKQYDPLVSHCHDVPLAGVPTSGPKPK